MHSKSRLIPFILILLTLLAGCAYENTGDLKVTTQTDESFTSGSGSRTVMPDTDAFAAPTYYKIELKSTLSSDASISSQNYYPASSSSITFSNVALGTYKVTASGYDNDTDSKVLIGYGEADVTVTANGTAAATITVSPVSTGSELKGRVKIDMTWASNVQIDRIDLVDSNNNKIASQTVENASTATGTTFNQEVTVGTDLNYHFNFYFNDKYVGSTGSEVYNIYSGQTATTDNPHLYQGLTFEDAITLRGFSISSLSDHQVLRELKINYIVPNDFASIEFTSKTGGVETSLKTITPTEENLPAAGETASFIASGLGDGTEYEISAYIVLSSGKQSEAVSAKETTAKALTSVELKYDETEANNMTPNGGEMTLTAVYTPPEATDWGGTWVSSNTDVATVTPSKDNTKQAKITGKGLGEAKITYTAKNSGISNSYTLHITLNKPNLTVEATAEGNVLSWDNNGAANRFEIYRNGDLLETMNVSRSKFTYKDTSVRSGQTYTYYVVASIDGTAPVSSDPKTIEAFSDPDFKIQFIAPERLQVTMENLKQNQEFERTAPVTLSANIEGDVSYQWYLNGKKRDEWKNESVTFNSSDPEVSGGYAAARQDVMLKITTSSNMTYSGTLYFYFVDTKAASIEFSSDSQTVIYTTDTEAYVKASVFNADGTAASLQKVKYSSGDESIATVDPDTGKVTAREHGEVVITATTLDGSISNTITIYVPVTSLELSQSEGILIFSKDREEADHRETASLSYTISENARNKEVTWTQSDSDLEEKIISVTENSDGTVTVTPITAGTAIITATSVENPAATATYTVTVYEAAAFDGTSNITETSFSVDAWGGSKDISIKFKNSKDGEYVNTPPNGYQVVWSTADNNTYGWGGLYTNLESQENGVAHFLRRGTYNNEGYFHAYINKSGKIDGSDTSGIILRAYYKP